MANRFLTRRTVLKAAFSSAAALAVPLPLLDAMLNNSGTALAGGGVLPRRYCTWFFGNGISPPLWVPSATGSGASWTLSQQLAPLKNVKSSLTVVSGLKQMLPNTVPHPVGSAASTTGAVLANQKASLKSIDQLVLPLVGGTSTFEMGVSNATPNGPELTLKAVSHGANGAANYPDFDPHSVFSRLFSGLGATSGPPDAAAQIARLNQAKKSVLDMVLTDAKELSGSLGAVDRSRLAAHLDGIRQIELRLGAMTAPVSMAAACTKPGDPAALGVGQDKKSEAPSAVNNVMADLMVMAFACDLVRSASFVFTLPAAHVFYRSLGSDMDDDFHDTICHGDAGDQSHQPRVNRGVIYAMTSFAALLEKLQAVPEGAGTLLDNSLIYATSCTAWGKVHGVDDWPVLLAGKAGGALKGDLHLRQAGQNLSKVLFSIQEVLGGKPASAGAGAGLVTSGLTGLV